MTTESPTLRRTCIGCGEPFPDGPRDRAPGGHFPQPYGYMCERCYAEQTHGSKENAPGIER